METLHLKLFGALRKYGVDSKLDIAIPKPCTVSELQKHLAEHLSRAHPEFAAGPFLEECAFASADRILLREEWLPDADFIAVLPPVCGG